MSQHVLTDKRMTLFLTAIDEQGQVRKFSCLLPELEVSFELLNGIVAQGHTLIEACILDEGHTTPLPLEAFDGQSFTTAIQQLEQEWQQIIGMPISSESARGRQPPK